MTAYFLGLVPLVLLSGYCGLSAIFKAELYPVHVRALGVAVPYAIAQAIFGGNAETAALYLKQIGHEAAFFWLVAGMMVRNSRDLPAARYARPQPDPPGTRTR